MMDTAATMISTVALLGLLAFNGKMLAHYWPRIKEVMLVDTRAMQQAIEASEAKIEATVPGTNEKRRIKIMNMPSQPLIQRPIASYPMPQWAIG